MYNETFPGKDKKQIIVSHKTFPNLFTLNQIYKSAERCIRSKMLRDILKRLLVRSKYLSLLSFSRCLHTRQPGKVLKILDTRQSEIFVNFH